MSQNIRIRCMQVTRTEVDTKTIRCRGTTGSVQVTFRVDENHSCGDGQFEAQQPKFAVGAAIGEAWSSDFTILIQNPALFDKFKAGETYVLAPSGSVE